MKAKKLSSLVLALLICASGMTACGNDADKQNETTAPSTTTAPTTTAPEEAKPEYDFGTLDLKGDTFTILNTAQTYDFYGTLDLEQPSGETLDDSIFKRNRTLEEMYKFDLVIEEKYALAEAATALQNSVLTNDALYDVAFIRDYYISSLMTEGILQNLNDYPEFQLNQPWWNVTATDNARVGKNNEAYYAFTDVSLVTLEGAMVTFFNEEIFKDLQIEFPYQMVLDGKWTFEEMCKIQAMGANLNGDEKFRPASPTGAAVYGHTGFEHTYNAILSSAGVKFITKNADGELSFGLNNEQFLNAATTLSEAFKTDGEWLFANTNPVDGGDLFKADRALMLTHQLKMTNILRDMESTFGIVPVPKWDASQKDYVSLCTFNYLMCMPTTNTRGAATGRIMDAMSYLTQRDIMDYFYNGRLAMKQLRTKESVEMLKIVRDTMYVDLGMAYGQFSACQNLIYKTINNHGTNFASQVESLAPQVAANLEKINESIGS